MKIKYLIISSFGAIFILFFALSSHFLYSKSKTLMEAENDQVLNTRVNYRAKHIKTFIDLNFDKLRLISSRTQLRTLLSKNELTKEDIEKIRGILNDANSPIEDFENISVLDGEGRVLVSTNQNSEGKMSPSSVHIMKSPLKENIFAAKDNYGKPALYLTGPIILNEKLLGLIFVKSQLSEIYSFLGSFGETGEVFLTDKDGYFLSTPRFLPESSVLSEKIDTEVFRQCTQDREKFSETKDGDLENNEEIHEHGVVHYRDYRGTEVLGAHAYVSEGDWCVIAKIDLNEAVRPANDLLLTYGIVSIIAVFLYFITSLVIARKISKPLEELKKGVAIIEKGNMEHKVGMNLNNEIGELSQSFDKMVQAVKQSRKNIEEKVEQQTGEIKEKAKILEDQRKAILNVLDDIKEEKEIASRERDKVNTILQSIGDGVFVVDSQLKIILINKVALSLCGYKEKEALGKKYSDILDFRFENGVDKNNRGNSVNDKFIKEAIASGKSQEMSNHTVLMTKKGNAVSVADSAAPLVNAEGEIKGCVVVFRDVTKEREIDRMKSEFLSVASHQLRTPLGSMKWNLEMILAGDFGKLPGELKEVVTDVYESDKRMVTLVDDLLNVSRIDEQRVSDNPVETDILDIVNQSISEMKPIALQKKVKINLTGGSDIPKVIIDTKRLREVVQNILSNSVKYNKVDGSVSVKLSEEHENIIITISDTGMGIPRSDQERVFSKFFRAQNAIVSETEGSGLGLFVVKEYVKSWGGDITFSSEEGKGSVFELTIPKKPKAHILDTNLKNNPHQLI